MDTSIGPNLLDFMLCLGKSLLIIRIETTSVGFFALLMTYSTARESFLCESVATYLANESWGLDNVRVEILAPISEAKLTVSATAGGSVIKPGQGAFTYSRGESVPIEAAAEAGYQFTHWSGSAVEAGKVVDPTSPGTSVTVDEDCTLIANFKIDQQRLTVTAGPGGDVETIAHLGAIDMRWTGDVSLVFDYGTRVTLTAVPDFSWYFLNWSGSMWTTESPFTFTMKGNYDLEAEFGN